MLRAGVPLVVAFCGGALSGCGGDQSTTPAPTTAKPTDAPAPAPTDAPAPAPTPLELAWENHFAGFGEGVGSKKDTSERTAALTKIMKEYNDKSIVSIWDFSKADSENCKDGSSGETCKLAEEFKGPDAIKGMFDGLFEALQGCLDKDIEDGLKSEQDITEPTDAAPGSVFLVWQCEKKGYHLATDTFIFDGVMIKKQNIVIKSKAEVSSQGSWQPNTLSQRLLPQADYKPTKVEDAWKNHFAAFAEGAKPELTDKTKPLDDIMKDYTADSVVHVASVAKGTTAIPTFATHKGITKIREMFDALFKSFNEDCGLGAPLVEVTGDAEGEAKQVFLVWHLSASGYKHATDTFVFDKNFRIIKQNIVVVMAEKTACPATETSVVV